MTGHNALNKTDVDIYLEQLDFDQRVQNKSWTTKELRQIVRDVIHDYFNDIVDEKFVIDVASAIHHGIFHDDEALMSATGTIDDMEFEDYAIVYCKDWLFKVY